jgi:hypothetical protein
MDGGLEMRVDRGGIWGELGWSFDENLKVFG